MGILDFFKKDRSNQPKSALQRKQESEKLLKSLDIPCLDHLPIVEEEQEIRLRTGSEIAERVLILTYLNYVREVPEQKEEILHFLKSHALWEKVSPEEKEQFQKEKLSEQDIINISWRSEAIWLLLWSIGKVDNLDLPIEQVEVKEIVFRLPDLLADPQEFIEKARIRSASELLDVSDLTYRLHWATRDASLNGKPMPANLNNSIVVERHYAINWVTYYADEWDEVTTDT